MSRKQSLIGIALFSLSSICWSQGFYVGAGLGPDTADFTKQASITSPGNFSAEDNTHLSATGMFGTIFAGYGYQYKQFYLAGEVNGNRSSLEFKSSNDNFEQHNFGYNDYYLDHSFGLSVLPGYVYLNTLVYGRAGYVNGHFKTYSNESTFRSIHKYLSGFRYGIGLNQTFTEHLAARIEYSHINYATLRVSATSNTVQKMSIITPQTNQMEFALIYNFV